MMSRVSHRPNFDQGATVCVRIDDGSLVTKDVAGQGGPVESIAETAGLIAPAGDLTPTQPIDVSAILSHTDHTALRTDGYEESR